MTPRHLRNSILTADLAWGVLAMPLAYLMRYGWVWHGPAFTNTVQPFRSEKLTRTSANKDYL